MKRAVVTGGAGFIGRWLVSALLADGWSVAVLDDFSNGSAANLADFEDEARFALIEGSIAEPAAIDELFAGGSDTCFHLAARINVQHSIDDPAGTFVPDVNGTLLALEAARLNAAPFLFMSSCMVYGPAEGRPIDEQHPVRPASPYAASKIAGEALTLSYGMSYGHPVTVVRPFNTYGPYQRTDGEGGVVAIFCHRALAGEPIGIFGDGTQTRDLLYVEDCVDFLLRAAASDTARGEVLNAGTGVDVTVNELARIVGKDGPVEHVAHPHPQAEIARLVCDPAKARRLLGWAPKTELAEGVRRTTAWLQA